MQSNYSQLLANLHDARLRALILLGMLAYVTTSLALTLASVKSTTTLSQLLHLLRPRRRT